MFLERQSNRTISPVIANRYISWLTRALSMTLHIACIPVSVVLCAFAFAAGDLYAAMKTYFIRGSDL